jgi:hypothetical protein
VIPQPTPARFPSTVAGIDPNHPDIRQDTMPTPFPTVRVAGTASAREERVLACTAMEETGPRTSEDGTLCAAAEDGRPDGEGQWEHPGGHAANASTSDRDGMWVHYRYSVSPVGGGCALPTPIEVSLAREEKG